MLPGCRMALNFGLALSLAVMVPVSYAQNPEGGKEAGAPTEPGKGVAGMVGAPGGVNPVGVLLAPAVQEELKLTAEQKTQVFDISRDSSRQGRELFQSMLQTGGNLQTLMIAGARLRQENDRAVAKILKPEQKDRLNQILLRIEGPLAVVRPEVASKLGLNPAQTQQVQATVVQMIQAQRLLMQNGLDPNGNPAAGASPNGVSRPGRGAMARMGSGPATPREAAIQQIGRILNGKQKAAFNKLLGEPFDLSKIDPALARPSAAASDSSSEDPRSPASEKSSSKRKRAAAPKRPATKEAEDEDKPKP